MGSRFGGLGPLIAAGTGGGGCLPLVPEEWVKTVGGCLPPTPPEDIFETKKAETRFGFGTGAGTYVVGSQDWADGRPFLMRGD